MTTLRRPRAFTCLALLTAALLAPPASAQQPGSGDKHALLIGVRQYSKNELRELPYTETDVEALADVLAAAGYRRQNIVLITQKAAAAGRCLPPTLANLRATLKSWLDARRPTDTVLLLLAGHGVQPRGAKEHYFCPADAKLADPEKTLLPAGEVFALLEGCKAGFKVLLMDACRNDPLADQSRGGSRSGGLPHVKLKSNFRADNVSEGGTAALISCSAGEKAYEHDGLRSSVFTHFVIEGFKGAADKDRDGKIILTELLDYVQDKVPKFVLREFEVRQGPEFRGTLRGALALATIERPPTERPPVLVPPAPSPTRAVHSFGGHGSNVWDVALSPNGRLAATVSGDKAIRLWDTLSGQLVRTCTGHTAAVCGVAFAESGNVLASAGEDKSVRFWDVTSGRQVARFDGHRGPVYSVALSRDGKWAVSGSADRLVLLWDLKTRKERWRFQGHTGAVFSVAISPDGWRILSGGGDNTVRYWAIEKGKEERRMAHDKTVYGVALSPDGKFGLSGSADGTMRLWDLQTGSEVRRFRHPTEVNGVAFTPDGRYAVSGCDDKKMRVWELSTGREVQCFAGHDHLVYRVAVARDGRFALSGCFDKTARLWRLGETLRPDLHVTVTWDTPTDVDLHVIEPDGARCYFGAKVTKNGGELLKDVTDGSGPEEYQMARAVPGTYRIKLHYYSGPAKGQQTPTRATVVVRRYVGTSRESTQRYTITLSSKDETTEVCSVSY